MSQTAEHRSYIGSAAVLSRRGLIPACRMRGASPGFTLVEVIVASALVLVVLGGLFSVISYTYYAGASTETLNTAKNIADYSLEYLRARNVTTQYAPTYVAGQTFYVPLTATSGVLPGLIDLTGKALGINTHPMYPDGHVEQQSGSGYTAVLSTLQGYVSLRDGVAADAWETNAILESLGSGVYRYRDMITSDPYAIRFGTVNAAPLPPPDSAIHLFSSYGDYRKTDSDGKYLLTIWGSSTDGHFTTDSARSTACRSYSGYRILTRITAHSNDVTYTHVQYYDVQITVYWMVAGKERSYATRTTIATY